VGAGVSQEKSLCSSVVGELEGIARTELPSLSMTSRRDAPQCEQVLVLCLVSSEDAAEAEDGAPANRFLSASRLTRSSRGKPLLRSSSHWHSACDALRLTISSPPESESVGERSSSMTP
jgi:hypothetical protein